MKRVVVDHFGGPDVLQVVEGRSSRGPGEVRVRVLAAGVSFTDAQLRAGTYLSGAPKPPFTPGYELVGVVEELARVFKAERGRSHRCADGLGRTPSASACRSPVQSTFRRTSMRGRS